jgi:nitrate reductase NapAB chaperone NapD
MVILSTLQADTTPERDMTTRNRSVSGLRVTARLENLEAVETLIDHLPGTAVHARDPHSGRLVVVQERASIEDHRQGLRELQALPGVLSAELVLHFQDPDEWPATGGPGGTS